MKKKPKQVIAEPDAILNIFAPVGMLSLDTKPFGDTSGCIVVPSGYVLDRLNNGPCYVIRREEV